jgi:hypothetical protein
MAELGSRKIIVRKGTLRYLRAIVLAIMGILKLKKDLGFNKLKRRDEKVRDLESGISLYTDIAKGWMMKCIKYPIISMLQD